jgi:hypothetical protein
VRRKMAEQGLKGGAEPASRPRSIPIKAA